LVNPASANGSTGRRWPELERLAARRGLNGRTLISEQPGHLSELARTAADDGARLLVVVGGDGSVNEVVNGIAGREGVELAMIPRGTGRDFARSLGIPRAAAAAVDVARAGRTRAVDLGKVLYRNRDGAEIESYFANGASAGISGAIARRANETSKVFGGLVSYFWATIAVFVRWENDVFDVAVNGDDRRGRMHAVVVSLGNSYAGGMLLCPDAVVDDGLFDVLLIGDITKRDLLLTLPKTYWGKHLPHPRAELLRGTGVSVESATQMPVEIDGEQPGTTPARFELVPAALRVKVPG
jgi:diacylglycerol kinase (ATP)